MTVGGDPRFMEVPMEDALPPGMDFVEAPPEPEPSGAADAAEEEEASPPQFVTFLFNLTKPLGITIEEAPDDSGVVYITSVGDKGVAAGLHEGDVLTGVSAVFGEDVWSVRGKSVDQIRSLVRCRDGAYTLLQVERGHMPLEERCEVDGDSNSNACGVFDFVSESELDYVETWKAIYTDG